MSSEKILVGSEIWPRIDELDSSVRSRVVRFEQIFSASSLLSVASACRDGVECHLSDNLSVGLFNYVKKLTFVDGVEWIARLRMPPAASPDGYDDKQSNEFLYDMKSEVATMQYIRAETAVPLPKIYAFSFDTTEIGAPFLLMDYAHGVTAEDLSTQLAGDFDRIPSEFERVFARQYAQISAALASLSFSKVGSLVKTDQRSYVTGSIAQTLTGPYGTTREFYSDFPRALARKLGGQDTPDEEKMAIPNAFIRFTKTLSPRSVDGTDEQQFRLVNFDLGPNNIIVDSNFNIISVIDWDSVIAVPEALVYRFPPLLNVELPPPVPGRDMSTPEMKRILLRCYDFATIMEEAFEDMGETWMTGRGFFSREAVAFRALMQYRGQEDDRGDKEWIKALDHMRGLTDEDMETYYGLPRP